MSFLRRILINYNFINPPSISNFKQVRIVKDDTWNNIPESEILVEFYNIDKKIGHIQYRLGTGQIGLIYLDEEYRGYGLGKQILTDTINEMKKNNIKDIWAVTSKSHDFWSNVFDKSFKWYDSKDLHPSVSGDGYKMKL